MESGFSPKRSREIGPVGSAELSSQARLSVRPATLARPWFERMRACGPDPRERPRDGHPTACVDDTAFGYVDASNARANVGVFHGVAVHDPSGLLDGAGKRMRNVKLRWGQPTNDEALGDLIKAAYRNSAMNIR